LSALFEIKACSPFFFLRGPGFTCPWQSLSLFRVNFSPGSPSSRYTFGEIFEKPSKDCMFDAIFSSYEGKYFLTPLLLLFRWMSCRWEAPFLFFLFHFGRLSNCGRGPLSPHREGFLLGISLPFFTCLKRDTFFPFTSGSYWHRLCGDARLFFPFPPFSSLDRHVSRRIFGLFFFPMDPFRRNGECFLSPSQMISVFLPIGRLFSNFAGFADFPFPMFLSPQRVRR